MSESPNPAVRLEIADDGVAVVTLDRPQQLNAIDVESATALSAALDDVQASGRARAVVLRANGPSFCGGGDVLAMSRQLDDLPRFLGLRRLPLPVVAAVQGAAAGAGFSLAMACDLVVAARSARFVTAYAKLGASSDGGLSHHLARRLGAGRALDALLLRDALTAEEAHALGLVTHLADDEALFDSSRALARQLARLPVQAVRELKLLVSGTDLDDLARQLNREKEAFLRCSSSEDLRSRVRAFAEKRGAR